MIRTFGALAVAMLACAAVHIQAGDNPTTAAEADSSGVAPLSVPEARRQATLLHETYLATLLVVHREYFDEKNRVTLPARAFEDVFKSIDKRTGGHTRWIAVNTPAMNVDHEPKPGFEKDAAKALANGQKDFESVAGNVYQRASGIPFAASCSKCHQSALGSRRAGRMAGLVVSLPVQTP